VRRNDEAELAAMLQKGAALVREGQAMIRAAENMGARADLDSPTAWERPSSVDLGALPGKSPEPKAEALYMGRRMRDRLFPRNVFSEPAWDILLALFLAPRSDNGIKIEPVLTECEIPRETGLRYVALLEQQGLVDAQPTAGGDAKLVALSQVGMRLMKQFFELTEGIGLMRRLIGQRRSAD
jgi:hypothetical protein